MVLNKTNANNVSVLYGDDTDDWIGRSVELFEAMVEFQGKTVPALRIRAPRRQPGRSPCAERCAADAGTRERRRNP